ncbi:putative membrane protein [Deinococcus sp. HSC-46F16]|uniref:SRPBCC family protein n=1 Tax=Deinococcus sp. HSC-46F16 TaxID=2910968 RepID=UPI0020A00C34|nr:SRPBCC family protein [Deinococcus sp. HSC-46F16]MCP2014711.1 putative membrane protein [Deinococcus sp. HSC-46F16]
MDAGSPLGGPATGGIADAFKGALSQRPGKASQQQRRVTLILGGVLLTLGLRRVSFGGVALALAGGALLYRQLAMRSGRAGAEAQMAEVARSITIGKPAEELYRFWRQGGHLPRVMEHFAEVTETNQDRAHWTVRVPGGRRLSWDTQVVEHRPGELVSWQSLPGTELPNRGEVRFRPAPGDRGTEVTLRLHFQPPGGALGAAAAKALNGLGPSVLVGDALRRFKSLVETGEIPTLDRNPSARASTA